MAESLTQEFKDEVRKQARQQAAKWVIAGFAGLVLIASTGWWLYFQPKIDKYIKTAAGGVPRGVVAASLNSCDQLGLGWKTYAPATARVIVGAGNEFDPKHRKWKRQRPTGGVDEVELTAREFRSSDGEESHILAPTEGSSHNHEIKHSPGQSLSAGPVNYVLANEVNPRTRTALSGGGSAHNNMPPYIALYFCTYDK